MAINQYIMSIFLLLQGSFMIFANEIKVLESKVIFRASWGEEDNQLHREKGMDSELEWNIDSFLVYANYIIIRQQTSHSSVVKVFNTKNTKNQIKKFEDILKKYNYNENKYIISSGFPRKTENNKILTLLGIYDKQTYNTIKLLLINIDIKDNSIQILNENLPKKQFGDNSFFNVTVNGGCFINQEGDLSYYDQNGRFVAEINNKNIMYTDKYGFIYIRETDNTVGIYNIKNKRISYFDVPPETGTDFKIDGGDVDSYLYQWKWDQKELSKAKYNRKIIIYKFNNRKSEKWLILFKGEVNLGECFVTEPDKPVDRYKVVNYIDAKNELLQIDPDGTIYHIERDEKEMRIVSKKIETMK